MRKGRTVAAVESIGRVAAEAGLDERAAAGVLVDEGRDVVDVARDDHELTGLARLLELVPREDGEVVRRLGPADLVGLASDGLELHGVLAAADLVVGERLELRREAEPVHDDDEPLGRVVCERKRRGRASATRSVRHDMDDQ